MDDRIGVFDVCNLRHHLIFQSGMVYRKGGIAEGGCTTEREMKGVVMPEFSVDFAVYCSCGNGLCTQSRGSNKRGPQVTVEPCEKCLQTEYDKGYQEGYDEGIKD